MSVERLIADLSARGVLGEGGFAGGWLVCGDGGCAGLYVSGVPFLAKGAAVVEGVI